MNDPLEELQNKVIYAATHTFTKDESTTLIDYILSLIQADLARVARETEKAFGGCKVCYGKGYATSWEGTAHMNIHYEYADIPPHNQLKFCECDRGSQLEAHIAQLSTTDKQKGEDDD